MTVPARRVSRADCANCTCLPGLLLRARRLLAIARRISIKRGSPGSSRKGSVFTLDAALLCLPEVKEVNTTARLTALRREMAARGLAVYVVPSEDEHQSEYTAPKDQRRAFVSGFSGSAGVAVVTRDVACMNDVPEGAAALATDLRYFAQAGNELDFNWLLLKQGAKDEPTWDVWCAQQAAQMLADAGQPARIGLDPRLVLYATFEKLGKAVEAALAAHPAASVAVEAVEENLVDAIWRQFEEPPERTELLVKVLPEQFAGEPARSKIARVAARVAAKGAALVVSALDEVAWLLNLRGLDIEYNPVFFAYAVVLADATVHLYADHTRFDANVGAHLLLSGVQVHAYGAFWDALARLDGDVLVSSRLLWLVVRLPRARLLVEPIVEELKAVKNDVELAGARTAHLKDGRALCRFFAWLEQELAAMLFVDEVEADAQLTKFRQMERHFVGLLFATISATGANGAVIHYKPARGLCARIDPSKVYLNDLGAQYLEGTTDTTRTVHFGTPTPEQRRNYTLVLKGNLALGALKFPQGTLLNDTVARQFLWLHGLDYGHGTSHGVGAYLNVHEGPIGLHPRLHGLKSTLKPGHLLLNEPGYYKEGEYGIRIENVMYVRELEVHEGKRFLEFATVTRVPYCRALIDTALLTLQEKAWVNGYHEEVWRDVSPAFDKGSPEWSWLKRETAAI